MPNEKEVKYVIECSAEVLRLLYENDAEVKILESDE